MSDATDRLSLPLLAPGQAQKELFHNEALARLDSLVQASVAAAGGNRPPDAPAPGQCWIVGDAPLGDWAGQPGALAQWTEGGWRFVPPFAGLRVWLESDTLVAHHDGAGWRIGDVEARRLLVDGRQVVGPQQPAVALPSGGAVVDTEARSTLLAVVSALRAHGLLAG